MWQKKHLKAILEGVCLEEVEQGDYLLCAQPLKLRGCDGAPCRAVLVEDIKYGPEERFIRECHQGEKPSSGLYIIIICYRIIKIYNLK